MGGKSKKIQKQPKDRPNAPKTLHLQRVSIATPHEHAQNKTKHVKKSHLAHLIAYALILKQFSLPSISASWEASEREHSIKNCYYA